VVAKVREGLAVSKQAAQKFDVVRFNLRQVCSCGEFKFKTLKRISKP